MAKIQLTGNGHSGIAAHKGADFNPINVLYFWRRFNPITSKWSSFCEGILTLKVLSEHRTEAAAHAACRRYESAFWRRMNARPLAYLLLIAPSEQLGAELAVNSEHGQASQACSNLSVRP